MKKGLFYLVILFCIECFVMVGAFEFGLFRVGQVDLEIITTGNITIVSPVNGETYNFGAGDNYTLDLNVSSSRDMSFWWYSLIDLGTNNVVYSNLSFSPNITFDAVTGNNRLLVYANDSGGNLFNDSVEFLINVNNSSPIIHDLPSDIYVCEGNFLSYLFNVSDKDGDVLDSDISPKNPFYRRFYDYINLTYFRYEIFSGILDKDDVGGINKGFKIYEEYIYVSDGQYVDDANINITVIEINNAPAIETIGVQTIWTTGDNSSFNYQTEVDDVEDGDENGGKISFNITFSGDNLFNISSTGVMNYNGEEKYVGVHNITVSATDLGLTSPFKNISLCEQDGGSLTSYENFSLTITNENRAPIITSYSPISQNLDYSGTDILYFNVSEYDSDGTIPDVYWYASGVFKEYDAGSLVDEFTYTFGCGLSGNYVVKAVATDGELNDSIEWNVSLSYVECPVGDGGGGSGGGSGGFLQCTEKWGCEEWNQCTNLNSAYLAGEIDYELMSLIKKRCSLLGLPDDVCGFQTRECLDFNKCGTNLSMPGILRECYYTEHPTCSDGIKNCHDGSCEILVDCGGPCERCPTCSDGIKNQGEEDVDCGGPCPSCVQKSPSWIRKITIKEIIIFASLLLFISALTFIIWLLIKYYLTKKKLEKIEKKRI